MQLEETIAKELADIINGQVSHCQAQINQLTTATEALTKAVAGLQDEAPPADIIDDISKAVALLAEAPPLTQARDNGPVRGAIHTAARQENKDHNHAARRQGQPRWRGWSRTNAERHIQFHHAKDRGR